MSNRLSMRRFSVLLEGLPAESAFVRWLGDRSNRALAEWDEGALNASFKGAT